MKLGYKLGLLLAVLALVAAACGDDEGGDDGTTTTTAAETTTTAADETTTTAADTTTTTAAAGDDGGATGEPILIGYAADLTGPMAPFDGPAIAAAQITIDGINEAGGVMGRPLELQFIDTQADPDLNKAAAVDLIEQGAAVLMVTCDVDIATPSIQEGLAAGLLTVAPCIGTDQMGPNRFGELGRLAFSLGNLAQDEGAVLAEFARDQGWETAAVVPDNIIVYFQDVAEAFKVRFEELGGEVVLEEGFTTGDGTLGNVVTSVANADVDVIAFTSFPDSNAEFVAGLRSLGDETPIVCGWACDGNFWVPEGTSNFYVDTFVSVFGDDPDPAVNDLITAMTEAGSAPATGGFITGAAAIEAIVTAIEQTGGTDGAELAAVFEGFTAQPTISGEITFTPEFHTVFGRPFRIIQFQDGEASLLEVRAATSPSDIG